MAVACFMAEGVSVQRNFDPPKRASLRAWYNAATKLIPDAPKYDPAFERGVLVDADSIIFAKGDWNLMIARRRWLRG
jgi:hypothetical protein